MDSFYQGIASAAQGMSILEVIAVILGVAYLVLAMRQNILCWYAAFGSTAIFSWLFWDVSLVMESGLNVYYLIMAVYGWWVWKGNERAAQDGKEIEVTTMSRPRRGRKPGSTNAAPLTNPIPPKPKEKEKQRQSFKKLKNKLNKLKKNYNDLDTLSMGMSADYQEAIAEGSTIIRIGTNIFGQRQ